MYAVLAVVVLSSVLAGCGDDEPVQAAAVSVQHKYGSTRIESEPKRVVSVGLVEQDALLALGVVPVATTEWFGERPGAIFSWAEAKLGGAPKPEVLKNTDGLQFEKIAALRPDLIVGLYSEMSKADYDKLSALAPTIAPPAGVPDYGVGWQEVTKTIGAAVGKPDEAARLVADVELKKDPLYKGFQVRVQGRDIFVDADNDDPFYGATSFVSVLSLPIALDGLLPKLTAALDGRP